MGGPSIHHENAAPSKRVAFLHPDLGLGGAERLIVDAALELSSRGHAVTIYTLHLDPERCFAAVRNGECGRVICVDNALIRLVRRLVRGHALRSAMCCAVLAAVVPLDLDTIIIDLVAAPLLILWWRRLVHRLLRWFVLWRPRENKQQQSRARPRLAFYCHFPDRLLAPGASFESVPTGVGMATRPETSWHRCLRTAYRALVDALEAVSIAHADMILVNSQFTARVVERVFPRATRYRRPAVLYPPVPASTETPMEAESMKSFPKRPFVLCISRFERKKNLELAIQALSLLRSEAQVRKTKLMLVVAGGYDERLAENVTYFAYLQSIVQEHGLNDDVVFALNVSDAVRDALLRRCLALAYTPSHEHFGIVPLEAMRSGKPVVACKSGGPCETVVDGVTGLLCPEPVTPASFSNALRTLVLDEEKRRRFGQNAIDRAQKCFSRSAFGDRLVQLLGLGLSVPL